MNIVALLVLILPLGNFIYNFFIHSKINFNNLITYIVTCSLFILSLIIFYDVAINNTPIMMQLFKWFQLNSFIPSLNNIIYRDIYWFININQLSALMILLICTVSFVVHIYSLSYMAKDKNLNRFLSYLSLFTFFMLLLVVSNNFLQLFVGWEGVGLCSYLLIGYYNHKISANRAAIKAFIVNRITDAAFIMGVSMIFIYSNSINFDYIAKITPELQNVILTFIGYQINLIDIICLLLFIGAMGKSAQFLFHIWLPDAMEGPTPVSALIHAATMVTAGVFLIVKCSFIFEYSPNILSFILIIGAITCIFSAVIAITQDDIKKIIAYSTCSQLGYMVAACGVSAYNAAIFHLLTHGFFKALLFLSAGNIIYITKKQNLSELGGLRNKLPLTYANFIIGSLAIIGIYPFAGFYSKDMILHNLHISDNNYAYFAYIMGLISAFCTAIYSSKIIVKTFHGESNLSNSEWKNIKEAPNNMNYILFILIFGAIAFGLYGHYILQIGNISSGVLSNDITILSTKTINELQTISHDLSHGNFIYHYFIELLPMLIGISGIIVTHLYYNINENIRNKLIKKINFIYSIVQNKFYIDEIYHHIIVKNYFFIGKICLKIENIIDLLIIQNIISINNKLNNQINKMQNGYITNYVIYILLALILIMTYINLSI